MKKDLYQLGFDQGYKEGWEDHVNMRDWESIFFCIDCIQNPCLINNKDQCEDCDVRKYRMGRLL